MGLSRSLAASSGRLQRGYGSVAKAVGIRRRSFERIWTRIRSDSEELRIHSRYSAATEDSSPIVFVPGLGLSGRSMLPTAQLLPLDFQVFVVDPPGCGDSDQPVGSIGITAHASMLAAWLSAIEFESAIWVGHSFGSQVAAELAVCHSQVVERLVLISPTVDPRARSMGLQLARLLQDAPREPVSLIPLLIRDYSKAGVRTLLRTGRVAVRDQMERKLPAIAVPTLVVRGDRDPLVPACWAGEVASLLPAGRLVVIPEAAHAIHYGAPHQLARAIEDFCEAR